MRPPLPGILAAIAIAIPMLATVASGGTVTSAPDTTRPGIPDALSLLPDDCTSQPVAPEYPEEARRRGIEGVVLVKARVGRDGRVRKTIVEKSVPWLDEAAVASVRGWTFSPARPDVRPREFWVLIPVRFYLRPPPWLAGSPSVSPPVAIAFPVERALPECDSIATLFQRHGFQIASRRDAQPVTRRDIPACVLTLTLRGTEAGESVRTELSQRGWIEDLGRSADGPDGTQFAYRRDSVLVEVAGIWQGEPDAPDSAARQSSWDVVVSVTPARSNERPVPADAFNARLAAAGDSAWAQAPATIATEFVGGGACKCARFSVEITSTPERFDDAEVVVTRDGFMDDSIRGDWHRLSLGRGGDGRWRVVSATVAWRCQSGRGQEHYAAEPCR